MNSGTIGFEQGIRQLREMFPFLDEELIISALLENGNNFEATLNNLLSLQNDMQREAKKSVKTENEKEISLFNNTAYKSENNSYKPDKVEDKYN
jgi:hypothetical protein